MPPSSDAPDPATLLRNALAQQGMRQVDLATRTGISTKHINQIAQGVASISAHTAILFERATGVPAEVWLQAQTATELRLLRRRPRVWWSDSLGVIEQLVTSELPVRYLRVTTNSLLGDLPKDAVELLPGRPYNRRAAELARPPAELIDDIKEALRSYQLRFGPNTLERLRAGATSAYMNGGEREYLAISALEAIAAMRARKGKEPLW